jgi:hypothetical protein
MEHPLLRQHFRGMRVGDGAKIVAPGQGLL